MFAYYFILSRATALIPTASKMDNAIPSAAIEISDNYSSLLYRSFIWLNHINAHIFILVQYFHLAQASLKIQFISQYSSVKGG